MYSQKSENALLNSPIRYDPTLTLEIDGVKEIKSILDLDDSDPVFSSIFDPPDHSPDPFNVFDNDNITIFEEINKRGTNHHNEVGIRHYTATAVNTLDDSGMVTSDFDNGSSSPNSLGTRRPSNSSVLQKNNTAVLDIGSEQPNQLRMNAFSVSSGAEEKGAQEIPDTKSEENWERRPQKRPYERCVENKCQMRIQKNKVFQNQESLQKIFESCNMDLSYIFHEDPQTHNNVISPRVSLQYGSRRVGSYEAILNPVSRERILENSYSHKVPISRSSIAGRPRKEKRTKCLKRDSTVTLEEKLRYFNCILDEAKGKNLPGIFLRDQAAGELSLEKDEHQPLQLKLPNFDLVTIHLEEKLKVQFESFRTIWRVTRSQDHQIVALNFFPSDEISCVPKGEMEISIFTLVVYGHTTKHLITSCQYLELVNFILGKNYNHLLNDNLAETTVGSDGKMISTQKHHASRVRSHVKKFLKRHVVKDLKKYTDDDRSDEREFQYRMALHNLVLQTYVKKPFESKVSIALMELQNVNKSLLKQAEFFTFKKI